MKIPKYFYLSILFQLQEEEDDNSTISSNGHDLLPCVVEVDIPKHQSFQQLDKSNCLDSVGGPKWRERLQMRTKGRGVDSANEINLPNFSSPLSSNPSATSILFPSTTCLVPSTKEHEQVSDRISTWHQEIEDHDQSQHCFQSNSAGYEKTGNDPLSSVVSDSRIDRKISNSTYLSEKKNPSCVSTKLDQCLPPADVIPTAFSSSVVMVSAESHNGVNIEIVAKKRTTTVDPTAEEPPQPRVEHERSQFLSKIVRSIMGALRTEQEGERKCFG